MNLEEDIISNYRELGAAHLAKKYDVTRAKVYSLASKLGVVSSGMTSKIRADENESLIIKEYTSGKSISSISHEMSLSFKDIKALLEKNGIKIKWARAYLKQYEIESSFFRSINTPEKAYWLGFLAADGTLYENAIRLTLAIRDRTHVERFKERLGYSGPLKILARFASIVISVKDMANDLIAHKVIKNKTFKLDGRILQSINPNLKKNFIHGYFDGDGSVSISKAGYARFEFCGTKDLMDEIRYQISIDIGVFFTEPKKRDSIYSISIHLNEERIKKVYEYFYGENSSEDFLQRKKDKFIQKIDSFKNNYYEPKTLNYIRSREINQLTKMIECYRLRLDELLSEKNEKSLGNSCS